MSESPPFSSLLSINRHLGTVASGLDPIAIVAGSSVYHIGWQTPLWQRAGELVTVTQALTEARNIALDRLREAGARMRSDGVVGVNLEIRPDFPGRRLTQVVATGTAVRCTDERLRRNADGVPFTSNLSGQELSLLMRGGYHPVMLVAGTCVYHTGYQSPGRWIAQIGRNVEMPTYTQALSEARELALERMTDNALRGRASGILGVDLIEHAHDFGSHVVECFVLGTAVLDAGEAVPLGELPWILSLNDPIPVPPVVEPPPVESSSDGADAALAGIG